MKQLISNWDELTKEQQDKVIKQMDESPNFEKQTGDDPATVFFNQKNWIKIDKFISLEMAALLYHHVKLSAERLAFIEETCPEKNNQEY
jgi:hypothetical protein